MNQNPYFACKKNGFGYDLKLEKNLSAHKYSSLHRAFGKRKTITYSNFANGTARCALLAGGCICGQIDVLPSSRSLTVRLPGQLVRTTRCYKVDGKNPPAKYDWLVDAIKASRS